MSVYRIQTTRPDPIRDIQEIKQIIFMTGELAEEIYNLIIGAREELEFPSSN